MTRKTKRAVPGGARATRTKRKDTVERIRVNHSRSRLACQAAVGIAGAMLALSVTANAGAIGYCVIPAWKAPKADAPEAEVMISRDFQVDIPLIRGFVPKAVPNAIQTAQEAEPTRRYLGRYRITGYDTCVQCCGKSDGITASGTVATVGRTCAASADLPFGTRLWIDGVGERVVEDRGGGVNGQHIDVLCADHTGCYAITGYYDVYIIED